MAARRAWRPSQCPNAHSKRRKARKAPVYSWYLDLLLIDTFFRGHRYHHTASATMCYALREALALVAEEGLEARWERHRRNHRTFVAGMDAMGLEMLVPEGPAVDAEHAVGSARRG